MKVILLKDVPGKGKKNAVLEISDGYAKNYLIPRGQAVAFTEQSNRALQGELARQAERNAEADKKAHAVRERIEPIPLTATLRAHEGKAFGKVSHKEILDLLKQTHALDIDRHQLLPNGNFGLGEHELTIALNERVDAKVKLVVEGKE